MNEALTRELMRSLTTDLPVGAAPVERTVVEGRRLRAQRRTVSWVVAATVAIAALLPLGLMLRSDEQREHLVPANPLSHTWWAEGTLHLPLESVQMSGVRALVQIPGGVVVLTDAGEVRRVDEYGSNRLIGRWHSAAPRDDIQPSVRAQDDGKVVWLDGTTSPKYSFVVYDPASGDRVASHAIPTGGFHEAAWLNEFEDGVVYWDSGAYGQRGWDITTDEVIKVGTGATFLVALENGMWVTYNESGNGIEVASSGRRLWTSTDGPGWFSPEGETIVTVSFPPLQLHVRDAFTGSEVAGAIDVAGIGSTSVYLDNGRTLAYVGGTEGPTGAIAPYHLISCDLASSRCTTLVDDAAEQPVLPSD